MTTKAAPVYRPTSRKKSRTNTSMQIKRKNPRKTENPKKKFAGKKIFTSGKTGIEPEFRKNNWQLALQMIGYLLSLPFLLILYPFKLIFGFLGKLFSIRENLVRLGFTVLFIAVAFRFAQLQLFSEDSPWGITKASTDKKTVGLIIARRGQIFIQDSSQNKNNIPLTNTEIQSEIFFDAKSLKSLVEKNLKLEDAAWEISSRVNLPYDKILEKMQKEVGQKQPNQYVVLADNLNQNQRRAINYLRNSSLAKKYNFEMWLNISEKQTRTYPQKFLLAATLGYTPPQTQPVSEINRVYKSCQKMVAGNKARGTDRGEYMVGSYGLEQKFCSELGGLNGLSYFGALNDDPTQKQVVNGADIYLTIDQNLQQRAEQILEQTVKNNSNENGSPKNGAIIVLEAKTGKIRAMASYPYFDPNDYQKYWQKNQTAFRNAATNVDYDVGSVMKPLTVAAALNVNQSGVVENGKLRGVSPDFVFQDYDTKGKIYEEINGRKLHINNAEGRSYQAFGKIGLKQILRDSINTGISDIADATGPRRLNEYYKERFKFGKPTAVNLPGDTNGNVTRFDKDLGCLFCYANFGFGQGFTASPLQLIRAYTSIANDGLLVEPYLVEKIEYKDNRVDNGTNADSIIKRDPPQQILSKKVADLVTGYMQAVVDEGVMGAGPTKATVPGYEVAGKTGTAEIDSPYVKTDINGKPVLDVEGNPVMVPCNYACNRKRGIYNHTFVGFAPAKNPQLIVLVKLSEPNPGRVKNFSSDSVGKPFSEMMSYALNYYRVPKDR